VRCFEYPAMPQPYNLYHMLFACIEVRCGGWAGVYNNSDTERATIGYFLPTLLYVRGRAAQSGELRNQAAGKT